MEINMVNMFYGDGDHQKNMGYTDSQLCAFRSYRFASICDNEIMSFMHTVEVERSIPHKF